MSKSNTSNNPPCLKKFKDPLSLLPWEHAKAVWQDGDTLKITTPLPLFDNNHETYKALLSFCQEAYPSHNWNNIKIHIDTHSAQHAIQTNIPPVPGIKNIIAVAATKGGVGKSTIAVNLALALQQGGLKTGLLDADLYGPNIPHLLGIDCRAEMTETHYHPVYSNGLASMSMGYLVDNKTPLVWRGPMATAYLKQMLEKTMWPDLDYLIVDLPPGTGDVQLTLCQKIPISGAILVSTPHTLSLADLVKGVSMFHKMHVPILGLVENMRAYTCPHCNHTSNVAAPEPLTHFLNEHALQLLGSLPLDPALAPAAEPTPPLLTTSPEHRCSQHFRKISHQVVHQLSNRPLHKINPFPKIVVEST